MQAAREVEGLDVLADTTPFRDGLGADGRDPAAVGARRRLGGGAASGSATRRSASGSGTSATATGGSSTGASGTASACRRARSTRGSRARTSPRSRELLGKSEWECYFDILAASGPAIESILLIGELFTDEHLAEMISHPLFSLGVDGYTSALDVGLDGDLGPPRLLRRARPLPDPPRSRAGHAAARGGDPQDDEHAGRAFRPRRPRPPRARAMQPTWSCSTSSGSTTARRSIDPLAVRRGVDEVLVNGTAVVAAGEHTGALPGQAPAARGAPIDLRSDICAGPTDEMWEAMRSARARLADFGDDESVNELEARGAELLGKEAAVFVADVLAANLAAPARSDPARRARGARRPRRTSSSTRATG